MNNEVRTQLEHMLQPLDDVRAHEETGAVGRPPVNPLWKGQFSIPLTTAFASQSGPPLDLYLSPMEVEGRGKSTLSKN